MHINNNFSSPNYSSRSQKLEYIMVHFTEMTFDDALERLIDPAVEVSAHYLIKEDGEIFQLVDDVNIACHAGKSSALNQNTVGIEVDNLGDCAFQELQMQSCIKLSKFLMHKYNIAAENFIAHSDVAPSCKIGPGIFFDWKLCAKNGLGIWHNLQLLEDSKKLFVFGDKGVEIQQLQQNLKKVGYGLEISLVFDIQTNFVIRSFQSKFHPEIIHKKGMGFYIDNNSQYTWCSFSELILQKLLGHC